MAAAVAAHECGHAVQHARMYAPLKMRSALVPVVNFSSLYHDLGIAGRYSAVQLLPAIVVDWYHSVCYHYFVQLYHLAGGNQCK